MVHGRYAGAATAAVLCGVIALGFVSAASASSTPLSQGSATVAQLNAQIAQYETQLTQIGADKKTLQSAIDALTLKRKEVETRISVTQNTISTTQYRIDRLNSTISETQQQIQTDRAALSSDLRMLQQADDQSFAEQLLSSNRLTTLWRSMDALSQLNRAVQNSMGILHTKQTELASSRVTAQSQQNSLISQRSTLRSQSTSLAQTKQQKAQLLRETGAKESTYQKLLTQAQEELASFSAFAQNAGGSGLLGNQTSCDSWGCYYNQRDSAWGNDPLNGTHYPLKSDGCLVTAMAMVLTHYGFRDVTPVTINSDPGNFAAYYPAYLLFTVHVDGKTETRVRATIDRTLATGNPVIVGLHAYGGTHFVVLVSGSNGSYVMRDPYVANGKDISFSSHYSMGEIYAIEKVEIT